MHLVTMSISHCLSLSVPLSLSHLSLSLSLSHTPPPQSTPHTRHPTPHTPHPTPHHPQSSSLDQLGAFRGSDDRTVAGWESALSRTPLIGPVFWASAAGRETRDVCRELAARDTSDDWLFLTLVLVDAYVTRASEGGGGGGRGVRVKRACVQG